MLGFMRVPDDGCALCRRFADVVERWNVDGSIGVIDLAEAGIAERFPEIDLEAAVQELTVSEPGGQVFQGSQALQRLTRLLPGIRSREPTQEAAVSQLRRKVDAVNEVQPSQKGPIVRAWGGSLMLAQQSSKS